MASLKDPLFQDPVAFAGKATPNALEAAPKAQKAYVEAAVFAEPRAAAAALRTRDAARKARK